MDSSWRARGELSLKLSRVEKGWKIWFWHMPVLKFRKPLRSVPHTSTNFYCLAPGAKATKVLGALDTEVWPGSRLAVRQVQIELACGSIRFGTELIRAGEVFVPII